jgi:hypothetical protein
MNMGTWTAKVALRDFLFGEDFLTENTHFEHKRTAYVIDHKRKHHRRNLTKGDLIPETFYERVILNFRPEYRTQPIWSPKTGPGRPKHIPSLETSQKVELLAAIGWSHFRIAEAIGVSSPTLRLHYRRELGR